MTFEGMTFEQAQRRFPAELQNCLVGTATDAAIALCFEFAALANERWGEPNPHSGVAHRYLADIYWDRKDDLDAARLHAYSAVLLIEACQASDWSDQLELSRATLARLMESEAPEVRDELFARASTGVRRGLALFNEAARLARDPSTVDRRIQLLTDCLELYPCLGKAFSNRASSFLQRARAAPAGEATSALESAWNDYNTALQYDAKDALALYGRASVLFLGGHPSEALADLDRAVELIPEDTDVYMLRGMVHKQLGDTGNAREDWSVVVTAAKDPEHRRMAQQHIEGLGD